jgi:hypothetical protein
MKYIAALLVGALSFASPSHAETPCDFKGISVGSRMSPAEIMSALGVSQYKTNPSKHYDMALVKKYGMIPAAEIEEWNIGPYCDDESCVVPYGIRVGNGNGIPVQAFILFPRRSDNRNRR